MAVTDPILSVEGLQTSFHTDKETIRAVDDVSFAVEPGRTLGIVGESGSGKSVTARSVMGLVDSPGVVHEDSRIRYHEPAFVQRMARRYPDRTRTRARTSSGPDPDAESNESDGFVTLEAFEGSGTDVVVDRGFVDLVAAPEAVVRAVRGREIAMIFQDASSSLNPLYTVGNQLEELLRTHRGLRGQEATETAAALLESVGIPDPHRRLSEYPHQFSGGMQQRAIIALALACEPSVLICDEPTTALDVTIQAQILELLAEIQADRDVAIVFITHDMGVIAQTADRVSVMYAGEIVETAPVDRLFDRPGHPYTEGLLESIPGITRRGNRLATIDGRVPTPTGDATACRFAPRCPKAFEECHAVHPSLVSVGDDGDHRAACLLQPTDEDEAGRLEYHGGESDGEVGEDRDGDSSEHHHDEGGPER
ncbi:ABC transporter ATP-binding protein [Halobacteria archaeon AArc-m2/3/4]|uniref:Nickel import system ATP-binding protein NikD n=1 Tax=Natronoglomus mannanivorans TaxID=2979990 RepID=A0ABT2QK74_9EURY|nr:ABC transporter ATP-binding protein [Halobacteria archaeon AArc-m2/3/4]